MTDELCSEVAPVQSFDGHTFVCQRKVHDAGRCSHYCESKRMTIRWDRVSVPSHSELMHSELWDLNEEKTEVAA